jgi:predicted Zn-dependent protease
VLRLLDADSKRRPELLLTAQAQVQSGEAAVAAQRLQTWVATQPRDATAWQLLAAAQAAQGQPVRAVRAEAEARVAQLDYTAALDRFKAAQDMIRKGAGGGDHIEASIIDTRARQVESTVREQAQALDR